MVTTHPTDYGPEPSVASLQAEVFRLEGEIERLQKLFDKWHTIAAEKRAEIERLRAALGGDLAANSCIAAIETGGRD